MYPVLPNQTVTVTRGKLPSNTHHRYMSCETQPVQLKCAWPIKRIPKTDSSRTEPAVYHTCRKRAIKQRAQCNTLTCCCSVHYTTLTAAPLETVLLSTLCSSYVHKKLRELEWKNNSKVGKGFFGIHLRPSSSLLSIWITAFWRDTVTKAGETLGFRWVFGWRGGGHAWSVRMWR